MKPNREAPCIEKGCVFCCDPVGLIGRYSPDISKITDTTGKQILKYIGMRPSKDNPDTNKIRLYECSLFNKKIKKCKNYDKRPDICRNTSCIDPKSNKSIDEQYKEFIDI